VVKFTPLDPLKKRLGEPQSRCELFAEEEESLDHAGIRTQEPRICSPAAAPIETPPAYVKSRTKLNTDDRFFPSQNNLLFANIRFCEAPQ